MTLPYLADPGHTTAPGRLSTLALDVSMVGAVSQSPDRQKPAEYSGRALSRGCETRYRTRSAQFLQQQVKIDHSFVWMPRRR
jgi:hypothetical protein